MKKTIEERVKSKLLHIGRKNRVLRILVVPALFICVCFFCFCRYCAGNGKRFAMIMLVLVMFPAYSSFSFPLFITGEADESQGLYISGAENVSLARETELSIEEAVLLEDAAIPDVYETPEECDVTENLDYDSTSHGYAMADKYDAAEILEASGKRSAFGDDIMSDDAMSDSPSENEASEEKVSEEASEEITTFSSDDWRLLLINKQNSIPDDYTVKLGTIKGKMQCDERIIDDLLDMLQAAKEDGIGLMICSPYRDMERQEYLFNRKITRYMNRGFSYMEAYQLANEYVTLPGASEHQLGLALDILGGSYTALNAGFADTEAGKWLAEHSCEYGFILRYPLGKEYITGIEFEPWHFRYVGVEAATIITEQEITLEEFWEEYVE